MLGVNLLFGVSFLTTNKRLHYSLIIRCLTFLILLIINWLSKETISVNPISKSAIIAGLDKVGPNLSKVVFLVKAFGNYSMVHFSRRRCNFFEALEERSDEKFVRKITLNRTLALLHLFLNCIQNNVSLSIHLLFNCIEKTFLSQ